MTKTVAPTTDTNEPADLDADRSEWDEYVDAYLPAGISPESPYYRYEQRNFDQKLWLDKADMYQSATVPVPIWNVREESAVSFSRTPANVSFLSETSSVPLSNEEGEHLNGNIHLAALKFRLKQGITRTEPIIQGWQEGWTGTADAASYAKVQNSRLMLTLDEAVELAHLLLLLVDVARDTTAVQE